MKPARAPWFSPRRTCVYAAALALVLAPACSRKPSESSPPSAVPSTAPSAAPVAIAVTPPPSADPLASIFGALAAEARSRPRVHPSVDDAFAAFAAAGVGVGGPKQSLGKTYKAAYCAHGVTASHDLAVLLCEYPDATAAAAGLEESRRLFASMEARETRAHKTLMVVTHVQDEAHAAAAGVEQKKVLAAFEGL